MRIAIIGGTGKVGRHIATTALKHGYSVRMLVRNPDKIAIHDEKVVMIKGDAQDINSLRSLLKDCHVVINTLGQPVKESPIYSLVTSNVLAVMNEYKIKRYIGVTGASLTISGDKKNFINKTGAILFELLFPKMMNDKREELVVLKNCNIDWTLVRLPFVVEGSDISAVKENLTDTPGSKITNSNIACFIIDQINNATYVKKAPFISN